MEGVKRTVGKRGPAHIVEKHYQRRHTMTISNATDVDGVENSGVFQVRLCICGDKESGHINNAGKCERCFCESFKLK